MAVGVYTEFGSFGSQMRKVFADRPILSATKNVVYQLESTF